MIDRRPPGVGYLHVLSKRQLRDFIDLIADWAQLSYRIERIVLDSGEEGLDGCHCFYHREGTAGIFLCAWNKELWTTIPREYFEDHRYHFQSLGLSFDLAPETVFCRFTLAQARAFTLLHVFLHELGHHHDWLRRHTAKTQREETYAERFANERFDVMLPLYIETFGDPTKGE